MSDFSVGNDILEQYHSISNKLKKRFLRKPNIAEACDQFMKLGQYCESQNLPGYAALCYTSTARCEGSLNNLQGETSHLLRAGRQFLAAERKDFVLGCPSPALENLQAGLSCFAHAESKYPDGCPLSVCLNLEVIEFLKKIGRTDYIEEYLKHCIEITQNGSNLDTKIHCLMFLAVNFIDSGHYTSALDTFTEVTKILEPMPNTGARAETLLRCEVGRVLLLLILRPSPQKLSADLAKVLEKYTWGDENDSNLKACAMPKKLFLLMQSLVSTCQSKDVANLMFIEGELWESFTTIERDLLRILVRMYK